MTEERLNSIDERINDMCGITGFVGKGTRENLMAMVASLTHRGPDDHGVFFRNGIGLGSTRLAILDLSREGHQPMSAEQESVWIVFNGEIYNFRELRDALKRTGHRFVSESDTEVILSVYLSYGVDCFKQFNGMFAIAIYDLRTETLVLARDRMGKKPLYWTLQNGTLIFGSELKALLCHPMVQKELNLEAVNTFLALDYVPTPQSIFTGIRKLEPATYAVFKNGNIEKHTFWHPDFRPTSASFEETLAELDRHLEEGVRRRLVADVPVGILLSGGIDSSTITYYASRHSPGRVNTFAIGFEEDTFDESVYARRVAQFLGTVHEERIVRSHDLLDLIPRLPEIADEPLADASLLPTYLVSQFARRKVTVALGGDGGDELFAGYPTFHAARIARWYARLPAFLRTRLMHAVIRRLRVKDTAFGLDFKLGKFLEGFEGPALYRNQLWLGSFTESDRARLFTREVWEKLQHTNVYGLVDRYHDEIPHADPESRLLYEYMRTYLMDEVLVKVDRASMAVSLEVRAPFLDANLVDFATHIPYQWKYRHGETKYILKKLMEHRLPKSIVYRAKKGFGIPLERWLKHDLYAFTKTVLGENYLARHALFNVPYVESLIEEHAQGRANHRKNLWALIIFQLWYERWFR